MTILQELKRELRNSASLRWRMLHPVENFLRCVVPDLCELEDVRRRSFGVSCGTLENFGNLRSHSQFQA